MKTTERGRAAEALVAEELKNLGYQILAQNWRSRACEIDLVAGKGYVVYLVEVKYRSTGSQGDGLSYITPTKLKQMHFAARVWAQFQDWDGDYQLLAASVDGQTGEIEITEVD